MTDLTDFLLARIAEDEATARRIHGERCDTPAETIPDTMGRPMAPVCDCDWYIARVLAECEAKRRIVEHADAFADCEVHPGRKSETDCDECIAAWRINMNDEWYLRFLALPYADHPDYREEWRP